MPEPVWPSVEQQVADTRATPGTALEQLIRENQDFNVLDEREAEDELPFPPWLRVYWRKAHPEVEYSPDDPSGGYPRTLSRVHAWMLAHPDLPETGERDDH
jgi:hypothetical protein